MFKLLFWLIVLFLALSFFGISVQTIINSSAGQENISYISHLIDQVWQWIIGKV